MAGFDPVTVTLGDERDRLDRELDRVVGQLQDADEETTGAAILQREARDLDQEGRAVTALVEEHGADATVSVRGLSAGEYARVEDRTAAMVEQKAGPGGVPGSGKIVYAAAGLVDAPFYDGEPDDLDAKVEAVANQSIGVRKWLEDLVSEHTEADQGNWRPLPERLSTGPEG